MKLNLNDLDPLVIPLLDNKRQEQKQAPQQKKRWTEPLRAGLSIDASGRMSFIPPYYFEETKKVAPKQVQEEVPQAKYKSAKTPGLKVGDFAIVNNTTTAKDRIGEKVFIREETDIQYYVSYCNPQIKLGQTNIPFLKTSLSPFDEK